MMSQFRVLISDSVSVHVRIAAYTDLECLLSCCQQLLLTYQPDTGTYFHGVSS